MKRTVKRKVRKKDDQIADVFDEPAARREGVKSARGRAGQCTLMLLLELICGSIVVVMPVTNAVLLPVAFWICMVALISCVPVTVVLLFGAYTGAKLKYDDDGTLYP